MWESPDNGATTILLWSVQPRRAVLEHEHTDMGTDPIRQALRPTGLGIGVVGRAEHPDENLGLTDLAGLGIDDRDLLAGIVDEALVAGHVILAHDR